MLYYECNLYMYIHIHNNIYEPLANLTIINRAFSTTNSFIKLDISGFCCRFLSGAHQMRLHYKISSK